MPVPSGTHDGIAGLMDGYLRTQLLYVAAHLRLADSLTNGPRSAADLAAALGADPSALHRILRGLAIVGIVEEVEGAFRLTDEGRCLQSGTTGSLRGAVLSRGDLYYHAASGLLKSVQSGSSPFRHVYGTDFFDHLAASPERLAAFQESMVARSAVEVTEVLRAYDFSRYHHVIDVGGGFGVTLSALLTAYPNLEGTLFDLPEVVPTATDRLNAAGLASRCHIVGGDAFDAIPSGGDLYLLSRVIHDWTDEDAVRILRTCRTAMSGNGTLILVEAVISDRASDHPAAVVMDLHMLVLGLGKERTRSEFRDLLARAGLELRGVIPTEGRTGISVLEAACAQ